MLSTKKHLPEDVREYLISMTGIHAWLDYTVPTAVRLRKFAVNDEFNEFLKEQLRQAVYEETAMWNHCKRSYWTYGQDEDTCGFMVRLEDKKDGSIGFIVFDSDFHWPFKHGTSPEKIMGSV